MCCMITYYELCIASLRVYIDSHAPYVCILLHSSAYTIMHIDPENELPTQEQPLIEEPENEQEDPQPTTDPITEEAPSDPCEEDRQDCTIPS